MKTIKFVILFVFAILSMTTYATTGEPQKVGKTIVVTVAKETPTEWSIQINGVKYAVYRGPRGGLYYYGKNGKKTYLTKAQKQLCK